MMDIKVYLPLIFLGTFMLLYQPSTNHKISLIPNKRLNLSDELLLIL